MQPVGHGGLGAPTQMTKKEVSSIAVTHEGRLLMGRRRDNGRWTLPGGHLNEGEHHHDGAIRELKEEAGIETDLLEHLGTHDVLTFTGKPMKIHAYKLEGKHATSVKNDPDKEVERWQWIDITNGLPKEILNSLHSPKNVVLQCLGLQPKDQEEPYMARVRDKLKMLKSELAKNEAKKTWSTDLTDDHMKGAINEAKEHLRNNGLNDSMTVKTKKLKHNDWIGQYRNGTAIMSRPTHWINHDFGKIIHDKFGENHTSKEDFDHDVHHNLVDTILHEHGHALADKIRFHFRKVGSPHEGKNFEDHVHADEEEFAEKFAHDAKAGKVKGQSWTKYLNEEDKVKKSDIEDPEDRHKETTYTHTHLGHSFAEVKHPNTPEDHRAYEVKSPKGKKDIYFARNPEEVGKKIAMQSRLHKSIYDSLSTLAQKIKERK